MAESLHLSCRLWEVLSHPIIYISPPHSNTLMMIQVHLFPAVHLFQPLFLFKDISYLYANDPDMGIHNDISLNLIKMQHDAAFNIWLICMLIEHVWFS